MQPSPTQLKVIQRALAADGKIRRIPGGFWISGTPEMKADGAPAIAFEQRCDDVWCDVRTIRAMEKRGWLRRTNEFAEEWRDTREVTPDGIKLA